MQRNADCLRSVLTIVKGNLISGVFKQLGKDGAHDVVDDPRLRICRAQGTLSLLYMSSVLW